MKFPNMLYVTQEGEGDDAYLQPNESLEECAEVGEKTKVGIYRLEKVVTVRGKVMVEK